MQSLISFYLLISVSFIFTGFGILSIPNKRIGFQENLFLSYILGITIFFCGCLLSLNLDIILLLMYGSIPLFGVLIIYRIIKNKIYFDLNIWNIISLIIIIASAVWLFKDVFNQILFSPIYQWDARSIWYYKVKQIFFANGLNNASGYNTFFTKYGSHGEYPILIPFLGAIVAKYFNIYNEYLPKGNLVFLLIGWILALISLKNINVVIKLLMLVAFYLVFPIHLTIGYNDIWLAIYMALSLCFILSYLETKKRVYLVTGLFGMFFCLSIKNDASLLVVAIFSATVSVMFLFSKRFIVYSFKSLWTNTAFIVIALIPMLLWTYWKKKYELNYSDFDFSLLINKSLWSVTFASNKIDLITSYFRSVLDFKKLLILALLNGLVILIINYLLKINSKMLKMELSILLIPLISTIFFYFGMIILYCISKNDLVWHLQTSVDRLSFHLVYINILCFVFSFNLLFYNPFKTKQIVIKNKENQKNR